MANTYFEDLQALAELAVQVAEHHDESPEVVLQNAASVLVGDIVVVHSQAEAEERS